MRTCARTRSKPTAIVFYLTFLFLEASALTQYLFPDTEPAKDLLQQILPNGLTGNLAQGFDCCRQMDSSQVDRQTPIEPRDGVAQFERRTTERIPMPRIGYQCHAC